MITDILDLFPRCRFISNVVIHNISNSSFYIDSVDDFLSTWVNVLSTDSSNGCILFIDEVQVFLAKILNNPNTDSYNIFITILGQLRKLNCLVILTSQLYNKVQKCLRDYIIQNGQIVTCKKLIPGVTYYGYYDMGSLEEDSKCKLKGKIRRFDITIHSPELYQAYDSFKPVVAIKGLLSKK